jgi:hypothetical protein
MSVGATEENLAAVMQVLSDDAASRVETIDLRVGLLEKVVLEVRHAVSELLTRRAIHVPITTLAPSNCRLKQTLWVVVQPDEREFMASFFDANVNATGDTETEAVENLKEILISNYERFTELGETNLGPALRKQFCVLKQFIRSGT